MPNIDTLIQAVRENIDAAVDAGTLVIPPEPHTKALAQTLVQELIRVIHD